MRVVIDTNVLVSGTLNPHGSPGRVLDAAMSRSLRLLYDDRILSEYRSVLLRPRFGFSRDYVEALTDFLTFTGEAIAAGPLRVILPDPSDVPFLEVAATGHAEALVTGNARHFKPIRGRHGVFICSPASLIERLS